MATESMNDRLSIKNLLFTKAIPNYAVPVPSTGYKLHSCIDCGDRFIVQSSYVHHINRKSVQITYLCRYCSKVKVFYNRCNLLSHIRSHAFKTATINVSDLKVEPLPLSQYSVPSNPGHVLATTIRNQQRILIPKPKFVCFECNESITDTGDLCQDRVKHFSKVTDTLYTCPVCLFTLPTKCALKTHVRLHIQSMPLICPECGVSINAKSTSYPYNHDCEGFKMMRATARIKCPKQECQIFHPNSFLDHIKEFHLTTVYKCICTFACFDRNSIENHIKTHETDLRYSTLYQCQLCNGKVIPRSKIDRHLTDHSVTIVYPCWKCAKYFNKPSNLVHHSVSCHNSISNSLLSIFFKEIVAKDGHGTYSVVKKCNNCKKSFVYKCNHKLISLLPKECPYKCLTNATKTVTSEKEETMRTFKCSECKEVISEKWEDIKKHFVKNHASYKLADVKVIVARMNVTGTSIKLKGCAKRKIKPRNRQSKRNKIHELKSKMLSPSSPQKKDAHKCCICDKLFGNKQDLESHMPSHKDPCMAYQCMECGQCFVVKPSFTTHMLLSHGVSDIEEYIKEKKCYNENALNKYQDIDTNEPLAENQCSICREQFENSDEVEKHFRVHGMAFLKKNKSNSP